MAKLFQNFFNDERPDHGSKEALHEILGERSSRHAQGHIAHSAGKIGLQARSKIAQRKRDCVAPGDGRKSARRRLEKGELDWPEMPAPATVKEILDAYDRWHDDLTKRLHRLDHAAWEKQIPFLYQGQEVMRDSGYEFGWGFLFDQIHHRGQLSTYLRPMGSTVPAIYGPSADESM
jgi:hypothetical protein